MICGCTASRISGLLAILQLLLAVPALGRGDLFPSDQNAQSLPSKSCTAILSADAIGRKSTFDIVYPYNSTRVIAGQEKEKMLPPVFCPIEATNTCFSLASLCLAKTLTGATAAEAFGTAPSSRHHDFDPMTRCYRDGTCPTIFFLNNINVSVAAPRETVTISIDNCTQLAKDSPILVSIANARKDGLKLLKLKCEGE